MTEFPHATGLLQDIAEYLAAQAGTKDLWTDDDTLILLHLQAAVDAADRQGYSTALLQDVLTGLCS